MRAGGTDGGCCAADAAPGTAWPAARQRTGPARRPARLQTARSGVATADGPADGPGCCAPDAAPGTARPGPVRCRTKKYKWTVDESIATINLIKSTDFKVEDVNVDLHKRVAAAIAKGHFTSHNMRESDLDGDQDLTLWLRSLEDVLREVLGDDRMAGHQHFSFEMLTNDDGEREFGASNGAVSFQIAQVSFGPDCVPVSLVIYIDGSFIKHGIPVKPIYGMFMSYSLYMIIQTLS